MKLHSTILLLASMAFALPTTSPPKSSCSKFATETANFDDLSGSALPGNRIPVPYKSVNWQGFNFAETISTGVLPSLVAHSPTNLAISNGVVKTEEGQPTWSVVDFPGSKNKTFSLESFYYGCVDSLQNGAGAIPIPCNVAITAWKKGFNTAQAVQVGAQTFTYLPTSQLGPQQQAFGQFSSVFQDISYVTVVYTEADETNEPTAFDLGLGIDDIKFTTCEYGD